MAYIGVITNPLIGSPLILTSWHIQVSLIFLGDVPVGCAGVIIFVEEIQRKVDELPTPNDWKWINKCAILGMVIPPLMTESL